MSVYMDAIQNKDQPKPPLAFQMKFLPEWTVSDQNHLLIDMFTRSLFNNLIGPLFQLFVPK